MVLNVCMKPFRDEDYHMTTWRAVGSHHRHLAEKVNNHIICPQSQTYLNIMEAMPFLMISPPHMKSFSLELSYHKKREELSLPKNANIPVFLS